MSDPVELADQVRIELMAVDNILSRKIDADPEDLACAAGRLAEAARELENTCDDTFAAWSAAGCPEPRQPAFSESSEEQAK